MIKELLFSVKLSSVVKNVYTFTENDIREFFELAKKMNNEPGNEESFKKYPIYEYWFKKHVEIVNKITDNLIIEVDKEFIKIYSVFSIMLNEIYYNLPKHRNEYVDGFNKICSLYLQIRDYRNKGDRSDINLFGNLELNEEKIISRETITNKCPVCGEVIIEKFSGIKCSVCDYHECL
jgi:hypothetical protein